MKRIIAILIAALALNSAGAQTIGGTFQARIAETFPTNPATDTTSYDVYLKLIAPASSPFFLGGLRYIATSQFPIALPVSQTGVHTLTVTMDPAFNNVLAQGVYTPTVNAVRTSTSTANAGEQVYSVNVAASATVLENIIPTGVEFRFFTIKFVGSNLPRRDSVKLLNINYRFVPGFVNNEQAQFSIQDNLARRYTDPFGAPGNLFYPVTNRSVNGAAGTPTSSGSSGNVATTFNSWSMPSPGLLPIHLVDFSAVKADAHSSRITWQTSMEKNSDFYEVERSSDARTFDKVITHMKAAGESSTTLDYVTYDRAPLNGDNYYRLKSVDIGGAYTYSEIRKVRFDGIVKEGIALTSNPVGPDTKLLITANVDQRVDYTIVDAAGKMVSGGSVDVHAGTDRYDFENLSALAGGTYYLTAKGATINSTLKISKVD
jgi:hypothetical protein